MELVNEKLGEVGNFKAEIGNKGILSVELDGAYAKAGLTAGVVVKLDSSIILDLIAKAIPGAVDDAIIAVMKQALQNL